MYYFIIIFYFILVHGQTNEDMYEGYKIFKINPQSEEQLRILEKYLNDHKYDVWSHTRLLNISWVVMVSPFQVEEVENTLKLNKFDFKEINYNFEETFRSKGMNTNYLIDNDLTSNNGSMNINIRRKRSTHFKSDRYYSYNGIQTYMKELEKTFPDKVTVITVGRSYENRELQGVKISTGSGNKRAILIDAGIHAREWLAPPVALHIIQQLTENPNFDYMISNVDWYIFPVLNPDGYEYSATSDRMWRKTRSKGTYCMGVDANRNWDYQWASSGDVEHDDCHETYVGPYPFSEKETKLYSEFVYQIKNQIALYISFHSFGSLILYPWGYTEEYHHNAAQLQQLGERVADAIYGVNGRRYMVGSSAEILYLASGVSHDWMTGVAEIPLAYTIELPGLQADFTPPASGIKEVVDEMFEGMKVFHEHVEGNYKI